MKSILFVFFCIIPLSSFAIKPPAQDVVDKYIEIASRIDVKELQGKKSKFECRFPMIHKDPSFFARAKTMDEAIQRLQLICIKSQCQRVDEMAQVGIDSVNSMSDEEFRDFLEFSGADPETIEIALRNRGNSPSLKGMTCETAPAIYRTLAFDSCFAVPIECIKTKISWF